MRKNTFFVTLFLSFSLYIHGSLPNSVKAFEGNQKEETKICVSDLNQEIDDILQQPARAKEYWGILVKSLNNQDILYQLNHDKYFIPASNLKLLTTASALVSLGDDFQIKTPIYIQGQAPSLEQLIISGRGDPTMTKEKLSAIAIKLKKQGITSINKLVLIDGYLPQPIINNSWEFSDLYYYYAVPINSLILEDNVVTLTLNPTNLNEKVSLSWSDELAGQQWTIDNQGTTAQKDSEYKIEFNPSFLKPHLKITGTLPENTEDDNWLLSIPQPAQYFRDSLLAILAENNIQVNSGQIEVEKEESYRLLLSNQEPFLELISPPLSELVTITNQKSDNLYAEVLLKYLATEKRSPNQFESATKILTNLGIAEEDLRLKDGSGLSRQNLLTPNSLVQVLEAMAQSKYRLIYRNSLSLAGENGTLKNRFKDTNIANNLSAKTGTLTGVSSLSGYLQVEDYDDLVVSIIVNQSTASSKSLRETIDQIVITLGQLKQCQNN